MSHTDLKALAEFKVLTFDCYGTLIDWETGIWDAFQPLISASGRADLLRDDVLEAYGEYESVLEAENPAMPYPEVLRRVHAAVTEQFGLPSDPVLDTDFAESLPGWPAFPDTADALRRLKRRYALVILSNVDRDGFAASNRKLGVEFDAIYTAQDIGSYKPDPSNFEFLLHRLKSDLGLDKGDVLHTAQSLFHDHAPARSFGLATAWIDRQRLSESGRWGATARPGDMPETDYRFHSMGEMAAAMDDALGAPE